MELNNASQEVHLSHYWNIVHKRWRVAVAIVIVVMLGTLLASYLSKPLYRSQIVIQIERENPNQITIDDLFGIQASDQEFLQTQYVLLKSRGLAGRVIEDAKLLSDPDFYPAGVQGKTPEELRQAREGMIGTVLGNLTVEPVRNTSLVEIAYIAPTPRLAQKVAEAIGDSYMRTDVERKLESLRNASDFLNRQIAQVKNDLDVARAQLQKSGAAANIIGTTNANDDANSSVVKTFLQLNSDYTTAQNDRRQKEAAFQALERTNPESVASTDPLVVRLTDDESRLRREYDQKAATFQPAHPEMQRLRGEIEKTHQARTTAVLAAFAKARDAARAEVATAIGRENAIAGALASQRQQVVTTNSSVAAQSDLRAEVESKQALLERLIKQQNETEVTARLRGVSTSNIHWVDHAILPTGRFNVTMKKNLQSAFPLAIVLGLAAIFFLEYMDRSIKTPEELERVTKLASLGVIPAAGSISRTYGYGAGHGSHGTPKLRAVESPDQAEKGIDLLPHFDGRSPIAEAYRAFRTSLLLSSANSPKVMVITSTFAREGKTTTSVNLAVVLAQMGKPVLLIDADLRRPRLQKVFRGKMNLGLVNYLAANIPLEDVIQETAVPHLSVVLSGPTPPNPSELLASDRMKHLIHEVRGKFAYVIFDSPPVLAVTDSIVLAASADGVVLCVHGGQTPRELVQRSSERLRQSNIPVLGAILNNLDLKQYGYTYKKNYYDYYDSEEPGASKESSSPERRKTV